MNDQEKQWQAQEITDFQTIFLKWYYQNKRYLPWRTTTNPYQIWISEIMSQQTRIETVVGYYHRFMEKYPTIEALAQAEESELLKVWEGLGYYSRARNLQIAAQQVMTTFAGEFPATITEIQSLKGIGPYTAGAIGSIAFSLPEPAIDGNLMRVGSRLFGIDADIAKASSRKVFDQAFREIISPESPGDMNQAFMDLGASVCTPKQPDCNNCPLSEFCYAYKTGTQEKYPVKTKKEPPKDVYYFVAVIENAVGELLIVQRPTQGLLANMWHFPLEEVSKVAFLEMKEKMTPQNQQGDLFLVAEEEVEPFPEFPVVWQKRHLGEVTHVFSHLKWHLLLFYGRTKEEIQLENSQWLKPLDFSQVVFPTMQQKLVKQWLENVNH